MFSSERFAPLLEPVARTFILPVFDKSNSSVDLSESGCRLFECSGDIGTFIIYFNLLLFRKCFFMQSFDVVVCFSVHEQCLGDRTRRSI